jgi:transposase
VDLLGAVVAGDREGRVCGQPDVVLEELSHSIDGGRLVQGPLFVLEVERQPCPAAEDLSDSRSYGNRRHVDRGVQEPGGRLVLGELVPGGFPGTITAGQATTLLEQIEPVGAIDLACYELAYEFLSDLARIDEQMRQTKRRIGVAVVASGTTVTEIYGVGPFVAAVVIGYVRDVSHFADRDHFAAYNGTAPIEVSSGNRKIHRLSRRGNRRLNHAIHVAAVTQIRHRDSEGRTHYDKKIAEGKRPREALRALKRRISDALFAHLQADARAVVTTTTDEGPGGQTGNDSVASAAGSHPKTPDLRPSHSRTRPKATTRPAPLPSRPAPAPKKVLKAS